MTQNMIVLAGLVVLLIATVFHLSRDPHDITDHEAVRVLEGQGYENVELAPVELYACGEHDTVFRSYSFTGDRYRLDSEGRARGTHVEGVLCCGWWKDCTVRIRRGRFNAVTTQAELFVDYPTTMPCYVIAIVDEETLYRQGSEWRTLAAFWPHRSERHVSSNGAPFFVDYIEDASGWEVGLMRTDKVHQAAIFTNQELAHGTTETWRIRRPRECYTLGRTLRTTVGELQELFALEALAEVEAR